jgi:hypothetical protein
MNLKFHEFASKSFSHIQCFQGVAASKCHFHALLGMKVAVFFLAVVVCGNAFAQQPPGVPPRPYGQGAPPPMALPRPPEFSNQELASLLRAQTAAIKSLSSRLDSLEERLGRIEAGRR